MMPQLPQIMLISIALLVLFSSSRVLLISVKLLQRLQAQTSSPEVVSFGSSSLDEEQEEAIVQNLLLVLATSGFEGKAFLLFNDRQESQQIFEEISPFDPVFLFRGNRLLASLLAPKGFSWKVMSQDDRLCRLVELV